jgi:7-carboxy-7-deazaguanine synthase
MKGYVKEVFTSIQGEGIKVGQRQVFVRMLGCNLACDYCDTPETQKRQGLFTYQKTSQENPIDVDSLLDTITESEVAITGGEPLLQVDFLEIFCSRLKQNSRKIYIDTNGSLPHELKQVIEYINTVALDFKIPSATGERPLWSEHRECLQIAATKEVFVKIVIDENITDDELMTSCEIIKNVNKNIPLVIQPVFNRNVSDLLRIQKSALSVLTDVRIIPQIHKYLNLP